MGANIEVENVSKAYGIAGRNEGSRIEALRDASIQFSPGSFTALMGPSGCGKSTLLNLLGALDRPDSGEIRVDGRGLSKLTEAERDTFRRRTAGTVFQFFNLLPTMTALENVALPLLLDGVSPRAADGRAVAGLKEVGLGERCGAFPYELSGGQMQRVAVARAIVHKPSLILADEPTGNLDSTSGGEVLDLLTALCRDRGITVVMATHSAEAAARADREVRLRDGRIV